MSDQHTKEGQLQRAKRLRQQIESLKSGQPITNPGHPKSLREQIEERASKTRVNPVGAADESHES